MFRVITIEDKQQWQSIISQSDEYDFYHTWDYHKLSQDNNEGKPELLILTVQDACIALPLLKREVLDASGKILGYDYTSGYGYVGPVFKGNITDQMVMDFKNQFKAHCKANHIISAFSRLHPTIKQGFLLNKIGEVENNSVTIQIDLTQTLEEQKKHYRKSNKSEINKLRKNSAIVWSEHTEEDINEFINIYEETMHRVNAHQRYFFDKTYYNNLFNSTEYKTQLVFIEMDNKRIAGALFVFCKNIIQYHLAGTRTDYMRITPMKLLLDEIRLYGTENAYKTLHLGGGLSASEDDPLFRFKRGFSKIECEFNTFKYIADKEQYQAISKQLISNPDKLDSNFFPLYRA